MNKQGPNGIEWADYTWNPTAGCMHGCTWRMPDGSFTECYAKMVAEGVASAAYPQGFKHHYYKPHRLQQPLQRKKSAKIFVGSMADLFGHWVPEEQIAGVLDVMEQAHWHTFQTLSKYPVRLPKFNPYPDNVWVGVSLPAGHLMREYGAKQALAAYLKHMDKVEAKVRFMSLEPLWFDAYPVFVEWLQEHDTLPFEWVIIGAASKGRQYFQPEAEWVSRLLMLFDYHQIPVFFKGNLNLEWDEWREEYPA